VVRDVDDLVDEAVSEMCRAADGGRVVTLDDALKVLATFRVESFAFADLEASVCFAGSGHAGQHPDADDARFHGLRDGEDPGQGTLN
jgi:hypothetical protein